MRCLTSVGLRDDGYFKVGVRRLDLKDFWNSSRELFFLISVPLNEKKIAFNSGENNLNSALYRVAKGGSQELRVVKETLMGLVTQNRRKRKSAIVRSLKKSEEKLALGPKLGKKLFWTGSYLEVDLIGLSLFCWKKFSA